MKPEDAVATGRLVLVGTPLGNREDTSPRARRTLLEADLLLCEDTRSPVRLLGNETPLPPRLSCFVANEHERVEVMLEHLRRGETVAFVSEAGMPVWSDPGRVLVAAAVEAGFDVDVVPGPSAATVVLALSGFSASGARFVGFLPRSGGERGEALSAIAADSGAAILYEAGNRVPALLADLRRACSDARTRRLVIGRELTKLHQEVLRGTVVELAERVSEALRGEVTVVLEGTSRRGAEEDPAQLAAREVFEAMLDPSLKPRQRAKKVAALTGWDAREVYERLSGDG